MIKKIISFTLIAAAVSSCAMTVFAPHHKETMPSAVGEMKTTFIDGTGTSCYGTLISQSRILSLSHCVLGPAIANMAFFPSDGSRPMIILPPNRHEVLSYVNSLNDFPSEVTAFKLLNQPDGIKPIDVSLEKSSEGSLELSYIAQASNDEQENMITVGCHFENKQYIKGAHVTSSPNCHTPIGTSGRPFLSYKEGKWLVTGIYHGFLKGQNKEDVFTQGIATTPGEWNIDLQSD
ncbi:hypothetical protein [Psychromonas sp. SP041]|uniref:hypothetical protein n=1 Tax=Psychromonas sp. SP041 TaxID=1365007 RepID=UPI0010C7AEE2|nr:hypothetical protein [Psychromonas sp. SP041]